MRAAIAVVSCLFIGGAGCMSKLEDQGKATGSIIGKKTQDVEKFDPNANVKISDSKVKLDPAGPAAAIGALGPIYEQISNIQVDHTMNLYHAEHGRYPKDHAEFMKEIMNHPGGKITLPVLPGGKKYQYDEKNHKLVIVTMPSEEKAKK